MRSCALVMYSSLISCALAVAWPNRKAPCAVSQLLSPGDVPTVQAKACVCRDCAFAAHPVLRGQPCLPCTRPYACTHTHTTTHTQSTHPRSCIQVKNYDQYVRLREHTLGGAVPDPSFEIEEGADIELPPVDELQVMGLGAAHAASVLKIWTCGSGCGCGPVVALRA